MFSSKTLVSIESFQPYHRETNNRSRYKLATARSAVNTQVFLLPIAYHRAPQIGQRAGNFIRKMRRHHHASRLIPLRDRDTLTLVLVCITIVCIAVALLLLFS